MGMPWPWQDSIKIWASIGGWPLCVQFLTQLASPAVGGRNGDLEMLQKPKPKRRGKDLTLMLKVTTWRQLERAATLQNKTQDEFIADALDSYLDLIKPYLGIPAEADQDS